MLSVGQWRSVRVFPNWKSWSSRREQLAVQLGLRYRGHNFSWHALGS